MSLKQDRQGVRTASELERKYGFGKTFAEILGIAEDAQDTAEQAKNAVTDLDNELTQDEIFNRLTNNGAVKGIYRDEAGNIYINADYLVSGVIRSKDGKSVVIDLDNSVVTMTGSITSEKEADKDGNIHSANFSPYGLDAYVVEKGETLASKTFVAGKGITIVEKGDEANPLVLGASNGERYLFGLTDPKGDTYAVSKGYLGKYGYCGKAISLGYFTTEAALSNALATVYDAMGNHETKLITYSGYPSNSDWRWFGILDRSTANNGSFVAHSAYNGGSKIIKQKYNGTWQDCEWENPPLLDNVRYRTTERWNGKPVYRQVVVVTNNTALSGDAVTKIPHDIPDIDVSMGVEIVARTRNYAIPYITASESTSIDMVDDIYIHLRTTGVTSWAAGRKWYFDMKYVTK